MANLLTSAAVAALLLLSARAQAEEPPPPPDSSQPAVAVNAPESATRSQSHRHDGFYLRLSTGFGPYNESISRPGEDSHTSVSGIATVGDFALGGSLRPGLVLGGAIWSTSVLASDVRTDAGQVVPPSADQRSSYSVVGPWLDYYFNPHGGLHLPIGLGLAFVRGLDAQGTRFNEDNIAVGAGLLIGLGYEWWVSDEWSIGILGRLAGVIATSKDSDDRRWIHAIGSAPSVLFTATYN